MNIWCISKYASLPKYGTATRLYTLTKEFIKLGHNATLITSDSNHLASFPRTKKRFNYEEAEGVPVYWIKTKKYKKTASVSRLLSWLDFERWLFLLPKRKFLTPDVVIVSSLSIFTILFGYYIKKKYKAKLVFEIRDIWPLTMTEEGGFSERHPLVFLISKLEKFGYSVSDLIVGTMPKLDLHVQSIIGYERNFFCSPLGFDPGKLEEDSHIKNNPFDKIFPETKIIVGYAGSMGITNALESFVEAIRLFKENMKIHFMLVGSGDLKSKFEKKLADCDNVTFLSRIEQRQVKFFLNKCDVLYLSTKDSKVWKFGQSMNKIVEYMLAAKPIIASYTGYPSMINEANCGKFVKTENPDDVKNAIIEIAGMNEAQRLEMGNNGRRWIYQHRRYSILAKNYIEQLNRLF